MMLSQLRCAVVNLGARRSSVERAFAHGAMGHRIDPSWAFHVLCNYKHGQVVQHTFSMVFYFFGNGNNNRNRNIP